MININEKEGCVGCNACTQICPKQCIVMLEDHEGFLYPKVDLALCIDCSLCEKVCPVINQAPISSNKPICYAAKNKDDIIREQSSSGGIFTLLAEKVIENGGVVFGAQFNESWDVIHNYTDNVEGLALFRGSKYVQSRIGNSFNDTLRFLKDGRKVLYSGTPCQIAALKLFLRKDYEELLLVDFICHGVPSPKVWRLYKNKLLSIGNNSTFSFDNIRFRDKTFGWKNFSFVASAKNSEGKPILISEKAKENLFMRGFLSDLYLRPSCHACPSKSFKSRSDITIADFWGVQNILPEFDDDKGVSLIILSSNKGQINYNATIDRLNFKLIEYDLASQGNPSLTVSPLPHPQRYLFFKNINCGNDISIIEKSLSKSLYNKIKLKLTSLLTK